MDLRDRIHEWAADHFKGIQYPRLRRIQRKPNWQPLGTNILIDVDHNTSKARISWLGRFVLSIYSLIIGLIGTVVVVCATIVLASLF